MLLSILGAIRRRIRTRNTAPVLMPIQPPAPPPPPPMQQSMSSAYQKIVKTNEFPDPYLKTYSTSTTTSRLSKQTSTTFRLSKQTSTTSRLSRQTPTSWVTTTGPRRQHRIPRRLSHPPRQASTLTHHSTTTLTQIPRTIIPLRGLRGLRRLKPRLPRLPLLPQTTRSPNITAAANMR